MRRIIFIIFSSIPLLFFKTPLPKLVSSQQHTTTSTFDKVYLIGSGPGEIDLLTRQAYQVLKKCSLVIADPQVPLSILSMIPADKLHVLSASSLQNLDDKAIKLAGSIFKKSTATGDNACIVRLVPGNGTAAADRIMANLHSVLGYEPKFIPGIGEN